MRRIEPKAKKKIDKKRMNLFREAKVDEWGRIGRTVKRDNHNHKVDYSPHFFRYETPR
jgi:hypothetical protein